MTKAAYMSRSHDNDMTVWYSSHDIPPISERVFVLPMSTSLQAVVKIYFSKSLC